MISRQPLGRTGCGSTHIVFGAHALQEATQAEADRILDLLLEFGVNHIDTAPMYGQAEERIGPWMEAHRDDFFLATKTGRLVPQMLRAASRYETQPSDAEMARLGRTSGVQAIFT